MCSFTRSGLILIPLSLLFVACSAPEDSNNKQQQAKAKVENQITAVAYPETRKDNSVDNYFGVAVPDPYRWLEDDLSQDTADWVKSQNKVTAGYLSNISYREQLKSRLTDLWNYERISAPFVRGDYRYFYRNSGLQNHSVVYRQKATEEAEVFLDPNTFSEDSSTSLANLSFSSSGKLAAYSISEGGSDWRKVIIIDVESKKQLDETLVDIKFSGTAWYKDEGFYYSSYQKPKGSELSGKTDQHILYYHKLGTKQAEDRVIFGATDEQKHRYVMSSISDDDRYLYISAMTSSAGNKLFIKDLAEPDSPLQTVLNDTTSRTYVLDNIGTKLYLVTDRGAPNGKIITVDATLPDENNWQEFIAETKHVLSPSSGGGFIFAEYMVDAKSKVYQYDLDGNKLKEISLPGLGSVSGFSGTKDDKVLYYSYTNYNTPSSIYSYDVTNSESSLYRRPDLDFDSSAYISEQVFFKSKDGTKIPMFITRHKDVELTGKNPTILYGYGGFNVSQTPRFSITRALWLEHGGIYAVPNIRGGGEYGRQWHIAGTKMLKQNVFDDFIAAAEYLIEENYTSSDYLALSGGSNGGLLVGAVMTQRPELMKVALPAVGVMDMLKYHTFTAGAGWAFDYGTAEESKEMFEYLKAYSPVHNVDKGVKYPATMVTTGDHDDRVVPAHSYKFAAQLQAKTAGRAPTLIRIETQAGHGAGTATAKRIEQVADIYGFTFYNMGFESLPKTRRD